jgi:hypothetical protein
MLLKVLLNLKGHLVATKTLIKKEISTTTQMMILMMIVMMKRLTIKLRKVNIIVAVLKTVD